MVMEPIKRISVTDEVVTSLKEMILSGEFGIGQKLPSDSLLCKQLGVSRPTLREAVKVLSALGYVNIMIGKGPFVADISKKGLSGNTNLHKFQDFQEFMQVRVALEPAAMELAVPKITNAKMNEIKKIEVAFMEAAQKKDTVKLLMLDEAFHAKIIQYSGNHLMAEINITLNDNIRQFRADSFSDNLLYRNAVQPHNEILKYMGQRDTKKSVEALKIHLQGVQNDIQRMLTQRGQGKAGQSKPSD